MALSSDSGGSMLRQHCAGDNKIEDSKSFYTDILLSRMISAANSAAALAAAGNSTSVNPLTSTKLNSFSPNQIENGYAGTSSRTMEIANNTKPNKKLSFSVDSLLTNKEKRLTSESIVKHGEERAEEEEDLEGDGDESSDLEEGVNGENVEDNVTIDEEREAKFRIGSSYKSHETSTREEELGHTIAIPKPLIPVSQIPNMSTPPNLLAGIAQAMAVAAAANAAANSRLTSLSSSIGVPGTNTSPIQTNGLLRPNAGMVPSHLPPGFPLPIGSRPPFLGKSTMS